MRRVVFEAMVEPVVGLRLRLNFGRGSRSYSDNHQTIVDNCAPGARDRLQGLPSRDLID